MHQMCAANKDLFQKKQKAKRKKENKPIPKLLNTRNHMVLVGDFRSKEIFKGVFNF